MSAPMRKNVFLAIKQFSCLILSTKEILKRQRYGYSILLNKTRSRSCLPMCPFTRSFSQDQPGSSPSGSSSDSSDSDSSSDEEEGVHKITASKLDLAKPKGKIRRAKPTATRSMSLTEQIEAAAKSVADSMGGDTEQTHSDLMSQLRKQTTTDTPTTAVKNLLTKVKKEKRPKKVQSEDKKESVKLSQEENIQRKSIVETLTRKKQKRETGQLEEETIRRPRIRGDSKSYKLFEGPPIGIFTKEYMEKEPKVYEEHQFESLFDVIEREKTEQILNLPPTNAFEEMIQWTNEGKLWRFPIDNEQDYNQEEVNTSFHEHVFLEHKLEGFPLKGPIRHFMELVVLGLSQNPYLSVKEKHAHIDWFKDYFNNKQSVLLDVLGPEFSMQEKKQITEEQKQISGEST